MGEAWIIAVLREDQDGRQGVFNAVMKATAGKVRSPCNGS
jgi:hypothetical protein